MMVQTLPVYQKMSLEARRQAFTEQLLQSAIGAFRLFGVYLGDRLGLYKALAEGPLTAAELAERAGIDPRYAREWLEQQTVAGVLRAEEGSFDPALQRFRLPVAHRSALADPESLDYLAPLAQVFAGAVKPVDKLVEAYRSGAGLPFEAYGTDMREGQARMNRAMFLHQLGQEWLPVMPDVRARLESDPPAHVADIGCGCAWSSIGVARSYPKAFVDGYELDAASVEDAEMNIAEAGLSGRVSVSRRDCADLDFEGRYDLAIALECVHDLSDPVRVLSSMRRMTRPNGAVLVMDERAAEAFQPDGGDLEAFLYGFSILHCLPAGLADKPSAGTGTVMRPNVLERYAKEAGFSRVEVLPIENFFFRFYRLHP